MQLEHLNLLDQLLPQNSLWKIVDSVDMGHGLVEFELELENMSFLVELSEHGEVTSIWTNCVASKPGILYCESNSLQGISFKFKHAVRNGIKPISSLEENQMGRIPKFLEETGGPLFKYNGNRDTLILVNQSKDIFMPVTRTMKVELDSES